MVCLPGVLSIWPHGEHFSSTGLDVSVGSVVFFVICRSCPGESYTMWTLDVLPRHDTTQLTSASATATLLERLFAFFGFWEGNNLNKVVTVTESQSSTELGSIWRGQELFLPYQPVGCVSQQWYWEALSHVNRREASEGTVLDLAICVAHTIWTELWAGGECSGNSGWGQPVAETFRLADPLLHALNTISQRKRPTTARPIWCWPMSSSCPFALLIIVPGPCARISCVEVFLLPITANLKSSRYWACCNILLSYPDPVPRLWLVLGNLCLLLDCVGF